MTKIYTKSGDKGKTSLFNGNRVDKSDKVIVALGAIDECNSSLGVAIAECIEIDELKLLAGQLNHIQNVLFEVGAAVASPRSSSPASGQSCSFGHEATTLLEEWIDQHTAELAPLRNFILPSGHPAAATLHHARAICRRAECAIQLLQGELPEEIHVYLNRLSDYLFTAARRANQLTGVEEVVWKPAR